MHEFYVTQQIVNIVKEQVEEEKVKKITKVKVVVGELTGIIDESLKFYFDLMVQDTILSQAELVIINKKASLFCPNCNKTFERNADFKCPNCGSLGKLTDEGKEFYVESIEVED